MTVFIYLALFALLLGGIGMALLRLDARQIASTLRMSAPVALGIFGLILTITGRGAFGFGLMSLALAMFTRARMRARTTPGSRGNRKSRVRTAALEMELDLDTGEMNGLVLAGRYEGQFLADMKKEDLYVLIRELEPDPESVQVLEAYLDRREPAWRDDLDPDMDEGLRAPPASGSMTEEEAYEVLGLSVGATESEIREAHRSLMKRVHPDAGGSVFLAARINEAKDILLSRHR
ncbi:DnaJ domain-containing protein [Hoeflea sp. WL0058]|uniref:DnaJ domain-containing protein n=1 Tax=Flavimaribacter sediminis TaxID=2865987 RepID=A0AAE3D0J2_9HYPH|nr:DnaJ domain-containing protein [Flavimaribacter sediminis]MBW8637072.1 DnaJ domain-containing protein [Flavimaribacter sediminis]